MVILPDDIFPGKVLRLKANQLTKKGDFYFFITVLIIVILFLHFLNRTGLKLCLKIGVLEITQTDYFSFYQLKFYVNTTITVLLQRSGTVLKFNKLSANGVADVNNVFN